MKNGTLASTAPGPDSSFGISRASAASTNARSAGVKKTKSVPVTPGGTSAVP